MERELSEAAGPASVAPSGSAPEALVDALLGLHGASPARLSRVAAALASGARLEDAVAAQGGEGGRGGGGGGGGGGSGSGGEGASDVQWLGEGIAARVRQLAGLLAAARGRSGGGGAEARARAAEAAVEVLQHCVAALNERVRTAEAGAARAGALAWRAQRALERACYAFRDEDAAPGVARFLREALSESGASEEAVAGARSPATAAPAAAGAAEGGGGGGGAPSGAPPPLRGLGLSSAVDATLAAGEAASQFARLSAEVAALSAEKARLAEALAAAQEAAEEAALIARAKADQGVALSSRATALEVELLRLQSGGGASAGAVLAHPRYQALARELGEARESAAAAAERVAPLEAAAGASAEAAAGARARAHAALVLADGRESAARAFFEARVRELEGLLGAAESARCAEAARAAEAAAGAAAVPALRATADAATRAAADWEAHAARLSVAAKGDGGDGGGVPMAAYLAVAEAFEGVAKTRDGVLAELAARDGELVAALSAGARAEAEKGALAARAAAAEALAGDVEALRRETRALLGARDGVVEAAEARAAEAEVGARAAAARGGGRGGPAAAGDAAAARELRAQNEALARRAEEAEARAVEAVRRAEGDAAAAAAGREAESAARKKLEREREKHRETREALGRANSFGGGPSPSPATGSATPGSLYAPASDAARLQAEVSSLKGLIVCSVCNSANKDTILLRCSHTFCARCVKTRLDTRQRKCPTCAQAFSAEDVKPVYFV